MLQRFLFISLPLLLFAISSWYVLAVRHQEMRANVILLAVSDLAGSPASQATLPQLIAAGDQGYRFAVHPGSGGGNGADPAAIVSEPALQTLAGHGYRVENFRGGRRMVDRNPTPDFTDAASDFLYFLALCRNDAQPFFSMYEYEMVFLPGTGSPDHDQLKLGLQEFDGWFARFWDFFNRSGLRRDTILVLATEPGNGHDSPGTVRENLRATPLFIWLPPGLARFPVQNHPDSLPAAPGDIMPTLFDLLGIQAMGSFAGKSLFADGPQTKPGQKNGTPGLRGR
jgi:hypothetical protein